MINLGFYGPHKRNQKVFSWMTSWKIINLRVVFFVVLFVATTCGMMMCFAGETRLLFMPWSSDTFHEMTRSIKQRLQARRAALLLPLLIISCVGLFIQKTSTNWKLEESDRWQSSDKFSSEQLWSSMRQVHGWVLQAFAEQCWVFGVFSKHHLTNWFVFMAFALGILEANWRPNSFTRNIILSWFSCHFWLLKNKCPTFCFHLKTMRF